jgi:predicted Zn-dependent protease with MMP-like domain
MEPLVGLRKDNRGPILRCTRSNREAVKEIKDTVVHELGHHFGLDDDELPY